jgi:crotonobetainyl-CoA:carnitine CoA-transferase CaiB-like acyl-CoA transferase
MTAGVWTALGVLAALLERQASGKGQRVDSSLFQTGVMFMAYHLLYLQFAGVNPTPQGSGHTAFAPYGAFSTADGSILLGISSDRAFRRLCAALENPSWADDPRFLTNVDRVRNRRELNSLIEDRLRSQPNAHWVALLDRHDVACDAVQDAGQVLQDPQLHALGQLAGVELPDQETAAVPRLPFELSATPAASLGSPPAPGEHSRAILHEAGYSAGEIEELIRCGAVVPGGEN